MDPNLRAGSQSFVECCCHCLSTSGWMSVEKKTFESKLHEVKVDTCKPTISLWFSCWQRFLAPLAVVAQLVKILVDHLTHCSKTKTKNNNSHLWLRKHQRIFSWLISSFLSVFSPAATVEFHSQTKWAFSCKVSTSRVIGDQYSKQKPKLIFTYS